MTKAKPLSPYAPVRNHLVTGVRSQRVSWQISMHFSRAAHVVGIQKRVGEITPPFPFRYTALGRHIVSCDSPAIMSKRGNTPPMTTAYDESTVSRVDFSVYSL